MAGDVSKSGGATGEPEHSRPDLPEAPLALYRRYRPATFAEVKGQDHVTEPLRQALRSGRVHHAYLFSGPRGCGKTSSARILARSLNCEKGPTPDPCGVCASCVALSPSGPGSIDVIEIDAASHGGIDDARDLRERAFYSPVSARYKIYIIDEAHMVTGAGFNALLKLVEEPPPHLKFVFATTEPEKVIPTIRSRTHHYPFRLMPPAVLRELLEEILAAEGITYEPAVLPVVIRAGAGSARDSLSVLDQLIAGADESGLRYERAIALLGYTDDALLDEMAEAFAARDGAAVFQAIDHVVEAGHDPRRFAMDLLDRLRDLIILAAVPDAVSSGLLDVPEDQLERMRKQAEGFGQERLARAAETISAGLVEMRGATSPRLLLELMCAQVLLPAAPAGSTVPDDLLARLERLELQYGARAAGPAADEAKGRPEPRASRPARDVAPSKVRPSVTSDEDQPAAGSGNTSASTAGTATAPGVAGALSTAALRERWPDILETVKDIRRTAWILLRNFASIADVEDNVLTMAFDSEGNAKGFASSGSDGYLADVVQSMFGVRPVIRVIVQPGTGKGGGRPVQGGRDDGRANARPAAGTATAAGETNEPAGEPVAEAEEPRPPAGAGSDGRGRDGIQSGQDPQAEEPASGRRSQPRGRPACGAQPGGNQRGGGPRGGGQSAGATTASGNGPAAADRPNPGRAAAQRPASAGRTSSDVAAAGGNPAPAARTSAGNKAGPAAARAALADATGRRASNQRRGISDDLADDPRLHTDSGPLNADSDLSGTDLIMRELGGRVIEEIAEG